MNTMNGQRRVIVDTSPEPGAHHPKSSTAHLNQTSLSNNVGAERSKINTSTLSAKPSTSRQQSGTTVTLKASAGAAGG